jgi:hypothetical protein
MTAGATYIPIATTTLNSANAITFSSIPSTYTDLILIATVSPAAVGTSNFVVQVNGDTTGTTYSWMGLLSDGTSVLTSKNYNYGYCALGDLKTNLQIKLHFQNYANTTAYKTFLSEYGDDGYTSGTRAGAWRSTSAINSITLSQDNTPYTFASGSIASLYGIASA